jgi:hypothetical protein
VSARERILGRVSKAATAPGDRGAAVTARLASAGRQSAPVPALARSEGEARAAQFQAKLEAVDGTLSRLPSLEALPAALAEALRARNLPRAIRIGEEPDFAGLDWGGTEVTTGPGRLEEPATLSRGFRGAAETGTVLLRSGPDNPVTLTFLGETHFVVLRRSELVGGLEDLFAAAREAGAMPRTLNFVTGPSRSADIGATLQLGAHGPKALHVFLIED